MNVKELRSKASEMGIDMTGTKAALIARIKSAMLNPVAKTVKGSKSYSYWSLSEAFKAAIITAYNAQWKAQWSAILPNQ
jgi:hypothetical protein